MGLFELFSKVDNAVNRGYARWGRGAAISQDFLVIRSMERPEVESSLPDASATPGHCQTFSPSSGYNCKSTRK